MDYELCFHYFNGFFFNILIKILRFFLWRLCTRTNSVFIRIHFLILLHSKMHRTSGENSSQQHKLCLHKLLCYWICDSNHQWFMNMAYLEKKRSQLKDVTCLNLMEPNTLIEKLFYAFTVHYLLFSFLRFSIALNANRKQIFIKYRRDTLRTFPFFDLINQNMIVHQIIIVILWTIYYIT